MDSTLTPQSDLLALLDAKVLDAVDSAMVKTLATGGTDADAVEAGIVAMSKALCLAEGVEAPHVPGMARPFLPHQAVALRTPWTPCCVGPASSSVTTWASARPRSCSPCIAHFLAKRPAARPGHRSPRHVRRLGQRHERRVPRPDHRPVKGRSAPKAARRAATAGTRPRPTCRARRLRATRPTWSCPDADVLFVSDDPLTMRAWLTHGLDTHASGSC